MKNYDEQAGHGVYDENMQKAWSELSWNRVKNFIENPDKSTTMTTNTINCIDAIYQKWTL